MNTLRNSVKLIGRIGQDPEVRTFDKGKKVARFALATSEAYTGKDGNKQEQTQWHNIVAFGKVADIVEKYLQKGTEMAMEGKLINRSYIDKEGNKKYITEVQVNEVLLLGKENAKA